jgi:hypothetical protein
MTTFDVAGGIASANYGTGEEEEGGEYENPPESEGGFSEIVSGGGGEDEGAYNEEGQEAYRQEGQEAYGEEEQDAYAEEEQYGMEQTGQSRETETTETPEGAMGYATEESNVQLTSDDGHKGGTDETEDLSQQLSQEPAAASEPNEQSREVNEGKVDDLGSMVTSEEHPTEGEEKISETSEERPTEGNEEKRSESPESESELRKTVEESETSMESRSLVPERTEGEGSREVDSVSEGQNVPVEGESGDSTTRTTEEHSTPKSEYESTLEEKIEGEESKGKISLEKGDDASVEEGHTELAKTPSEEQRMAETEGESALAEKAEGEESVAQAMKEEGESALAEKTEEGESTLTEKTEEGEESKDNSDMVEGKSNDAAASDGENNAGEAEREKEVSSAVHGQEGAIGNEEGEESKGQGVIEEGENVGLEEGAKEGEEGAKEGEEGAKAGEEEEGAKAGEEQEGAKAGEEEEGGEVVQEEGESPMITAPQKALRPPKTRRTVSGRRAPVRIMDDYTAEQIEKMVDKMIETSKAPEKDAFGSVRYWLSQQIREAALEARYDDGIKFGRADEMLEVFMMRGNTCDTRESRLQELNSKLDQAKQNLATSNDKWKEKMSKCRESQAARIGLLESRHRKQMEEFERQWADPNFLTQFNKPSSQLIGLRVSEQQCAMSKQFERAKMLKAEADLLQKEECLEAQKRAVTAMRNEFQALDFKQRREMECLLAYQKRNMECWEKIRDREIKPLEQIIERLEALIEPLQKRKRKKSKRVTEPLVSPASRPIRNTNRAVTAMRQTQSLNVPGIRMRKFIRTKKLKRDSPHRSEKKDVEESGVAV